MPLSEAQLEAFIAVAEALNFTKAATRLHITQSALSQRILNLEETLQTTLFLRDRAGLKLTEEAFVLLRYCQTKNHLEAETLTRIKTSDKNQLAGILRVGGISSMMRSIIQPAMTPLFIKHPSIRYSLMTHELDQLPGLLKRGEIDYLIAYPNMETDREDIQEIPLGTEQYVLTKHIKYAGPDIYLDHNYEDRITLDYLKLTSRINTQHIQRRYLDDIYGLIDGVRNKLGMAVLPNHMLENIQDITIIQPKTILKIPVALYFYKRAYYPKLHHSLLIQIISYSRDHLQQC